jgi:hypothetical protein
VVYFEFSPDRQFPSLGWSDFVVVLASWWMVALNEITNGVSEATLQFMDGPYWITVVRKEGGLLLRCTEDRRGAGILHECRLRLDDLTGEIFNFARNVSEACKLAEISSIDLDNMRGALPN